MHSEVMAMCADTIELSVTCYGCYQEIVSPNDADMDLFRNGYRVHNDDECFQLMLINLDIA
jgi:hypothetical protein